MTGTIIGVVLAAAALYILLRSMFPRLFYRLSGKAASEMTSGGQSSACSGGCGSCKGCPYAAKAADQKVCNTKGG